MKFTHFNEKGLAKMVEIDKKDNTKRVAKASGKVIMSKHTLELIKSKKVNKGNVLSVAQIAGIMAAKKTSEIIPMCHNIPLTGVDLDFEIDEVNSLIVIHSKVSTIGKTGVEMEALTAVNISALTIYDMCKSIDKEMVISDIKLIEKIGGKSGHFLREEVNSGESNSY